MKAHLGVLLVAGSAALVPAQDSVPGYQMSKPPVIDGVIGEEEWAAVPGGSGGFDEQTGDPCPEPMRFWIAYDDTFVYFSARMADSTPRSIRATERRRNVSLEGDDRAILAIDPFGTLADINQFEMNANGATNLRIAGGRAAKLEWQGEFTSRGRITSEGWECEARVPWALMRLPAPGRRTLRMTFGRVLQKALRAYIWNDISGGRPNNIGRWTDVEVPAADTRRTLHLLPFAYAGHDPDTGKVFNAGLDFKSALTSDIELVGTVNPDFRNVENEILSLDFSHFERLAGETRPFFREGAEYFATSRDAPLFASQRISRFDTGIKAYGRLSDRTTFAVLDTADFGRTNASVGTLNYTFAPTTSGTVGVSNRDGEDGANQATFLGFSHGMGATSVFGQYMTSADSAVGGGARFNTGVIYEGAGLNGFVEFTRIDEDFKPGLGFAPERGYHGFNSGIAYEKPMATGRLMEVKARASFADLQARGGGLHRRTVGGSASAGFRDGTGVELGAEFEEFGGFENRIAFVRLERPRGDPYRRWQVGYGWGEIAGEAYQIFSPSVSFRPLPYFQVNLSHQSVRHLENRDQTILSANYELNVDESVSGRLVRRRGDTNFYLSFRRSGNRGAEYYVIVGDPNADTFRASLILKVAVPFQLKF